MEFKENINVSTIVIVGTWNFGIFTPEWVKENVLQDEGEIQVLYPTTPMLSLKYVVKDKYSFAINNNRLEFQLLSNTEENSIELLKPIRNILRCLVYTPIQSCGINFVFSCKEMGETIAKLGNTERLTGLLKSNLISIELTRSYKIKDNCILNLKILQADDNTLFDFNYSFTTKNNKEILDVLGDDNIINVYRFKSNSLLNDLYNEDK